MPHGWAVAEMWLLLRDCLVYEDGDRLHLLPGVPDAWFTNEQGMDVRNLPTYFGKCSFEYAPGRNGATLALSGDASPPEGFVLRVPTSLKAKAIADGAEIPRSDNGDWTLPPGTERVRFEWEE
jgi:hypothetical protein